MQATLPVIDFVQLLNNTLCNCFLIHCLKDNQTAVLWNFRMRVVCLREHADNGVKDDLCLVEVCCCDVYENVLCVERNLRMITINNRWHTQHNAVLITNHRIPWLIADDPKVMPQMAVSWVKIHEFCGSEFPRLVQWPEANFWRDIGIVDKWRLNRVKVMCTYCHQWTLTTNVVVQFVLKQTDWKMSYNKKFGINMGSAATYAPNSSHLMAEIWLLALEAMTIKCKGNDIPPQESVDWEKGSSANDSWD